MTSCQDLRGQPWRESWAKAMSRAYTFFNQSSLSFLVTWPNQRSRLQDIQRLIWVTIIKALSSTLEQLLLNEAPPSESWTFLSCQAFVTINFGQPSLTAIKHDSLNSCPVQATLHRQRHSPGPWSGNRSELTAATVHRSD